MGTQIANKLGFTLVTGKTAPAPAKPAAKGKAKVTVKTTTRKIVKPATKTVKVTVKPKVVTKTVTAAPAGKVVPAVVKAPVTPAPAKAAAPTGKVAPAVVAAPKKLRRLMAKVSRDLDTAVKQNSKVFSEVLSQEGRLSKTNSRRLEQRDLKSVKSLLKDIKTSTKSSKAGTKNTRTLKRSKRSDDDSDDMEDLTKARDISGLEYDHKNATQELHVIKKGWGLAMKELKIALKLKEEINKAIGMAGTESTDFLNGIVNRESQVFAPVLSH